MYLTNLNNVSLKLYWNLCMALIKISNIEAKTKIKEHIMLWMPLKRFQRHQSNLEHMISKNLLYSGVFRSSYILYLRNSKNRKKVVYKVNSRVKLRCKEKKNMWLPWLVIIAGALCAFSSKPFRPFLLWWCKMKQFWSRWCSSWRCSFRWKFGRKCSSSTCECI